MLSYSINKKSTCFYVFKKRKVSLKYKLFKTEGVITLEKPHTFLKCKINYSVYDTVGKDLSKTFRFSNGRKRITMRK